MAGQLATDISEKCSAFISGSSISILVTLDPKE